MSDAILQSWCLQSWRFSFKDLFLFLILCSCVSVFVCASVLRGQQRMTDSQAVVWGGEFYAGGLARVGVALQCSAMRERTPYD